MNPFRIIPKVLASIWWGLLLGLVVLAIGATGVRQFGAWWGAPLAIVIILVGLVVLGALGVVVSVLVDLLRDAWRQAEWRWDRKHQAKDS